MSDRSPRDEHRFRRTPGGYRRADVDRYVAEVEKVRSAWSEELARLRKVAPLARLGDDVAELLTSFATTVLTTQERLHEDAQRRRIEAEEYASRRVADADRLLELARQQARQLTRGIIREAQAELAVVADQQLTIADALEGAARGIAVSRQAISRIQQAPRTTVVTLPSREPGTLDRQPQAPVPRDGLPPGRSASG